MVHALCNINEKETTPFCSGDETGEVTPVLIPNTAVTFSRGDGTAFAGE